MSNIVTIVLTVIAVSILIALCLGCIYLFIAAMYTLGDIIKWAGGKWKR